MKTIELQDRATYRRAHSDYGIGAAFERDMTEPGRDGRKFLCVVTDTKNGFGRIEVLAPRVPHGREVDPETIEEFVEKRAGSFAIESRMQDLLAASPLRIELFLSRDLQERSSALLLSRESSRL
jgi:hypothetical protein